MAEETTPQNESPAIRRMLVAVDTSTESAYAAEYALWLAQTVNAGIVFATVGEASGFSEPAYHATSPVTEDIVEQEAESETLEMGPESLQRDLLDSWRRAAAARGLESHAVFDYGGTVQALLQVAEVQHADLIVCGTHGRRGISRMFMGSVAENLLRHSTIPVLVVKRPASS
jgi:nucleotide-binding universal stress UspA family protein